MTEILLSPDRRFAVVQSEPWMAPQLEAIQQASFPSLARDELITAEHYKAHLRVFPQGQHAVLELETGQVDSRSGWPETVRPKVVACSTDFRTHVDFSHYQHRYLEAVGGNWLTSHDPAGDWLYGADIGVHPEFRGFGLSTLLYTARQALVRQLGLKGHVAGAMPKGFAPYQRDLFIEQYVARVVKGEMFDPVLSIQLKRGYHVWGIIPNYLDDPSCGNYGVFVVWRNPAWAQARQG
ncbi:GNAT family N-acetyltransferase [uncultured Meiothermus sp.]|jgi:GNAT superfamily N-acetyltransferase|uniref:GNAT family N-acetyltransferase n=1 Tax=uncultured Meiothermus sp. TaxID=157471 RepID=UPI0026397331|nr:GNAT family N-acetyltransferase [uncultured Meiothermus sp.]